TINSSNAPSDNDVSVSVASSGTLIIDGVDITITSLAGVGALSNTTIEAINGAHVTVASSAAGITAASTLTYDIGANSSLNLQAGLANVGLLNNTTVNFENTGGTGQFTMTPAAINLGLTTFPVVTGLSNGDKITVAGATSAALTGNTLTF